jgi:hypothetical protein
VNIVAAAMRRAGTAADRAVLRVALAGLAGVPVATGTTGRFSFTAAREPDEQAEVQIVEHGRFVGYR